MIKLSALSQVLPQVLAHALPQECLLCGSNAYGDIGLCLPCELDLPYPLCGCKRCGIELGSEPPLHGYCGQCLTEPPLFDRCIPLLRYEYPVRELIASFKFHARFAEGQTLARLLAKRASCRFEEGGKPEILLPVPLHSTRLRERGFNQSMELARVIGQHCGIAVDGTYCQRSRATPSQRGLSAEERAVNLRNAFTLRTGNRHKNLRHVAIVDDVVTTMTTVNALTQLLRRAGFARIDVLCLARVSQE